MKGRRLKPVKKTMAAVLFLRRKSKTRAIIQLTVFCLLQVSLVLPPIIQALDQREGRNVCRKDHALCGCAPARVAAGTCCCAIADLPSCCQEEVETKGPKLSVPPCGSDDPVIAATIEDYLLAEKPLIEVVCGVFRYASASPRQCVERFARPPIPPPQDLRQS